MVRGAKGWSLPGSSAGATNPQTHHEGFSGATRRDRTGDLLITNRLTLFSRSVTEFYVVLRQQVKSGACTTTRITVDEHQET